MYVLACAPGQHWFIHFLQWSLRIFLPTYYQPPANMLAKAMSLTGERGGGSHLFFYPALFVKNVCMEDTEV